MSKIDPRPPEGLPVPAPLPETLDEFKAQMIAYGICENEHQAHAVAHMLAQEAGK